VDNTEKFTAIEFCAGYGGISYGIARVITNLRVIAYAEIEAYCCTILANRMDKGLLDAAPIWNNIKTFPGKSFHRKVHGNRQELWPTMQVSTGAHRNKNGEYVQKLAGAVKQWSTPITEEHGIAKKKRHSQHLDEQANGKLNPEWVECLMGLPIGWTDCER